MSIDNNMVKQIYARAQRKFFVKNMAMALANREPGDALKVQGGRKYHRPIIGFAQMQSYTPLTATSVSQNIETANEELTVDRSTDAESIHINIDDTEKSQLKDQDLVARYGDDLGQAMKDSVEKGWVGKIESVQTLGSAAAPIDFSGTTILDTVEDGLGLVDVADVDEIQRVILMGPRAYRAIEKATANRTTALGDQTYLGGYPARSLMDSMLVKSNNLPWSATLAMGTAPSDGDTVTVAGVTATYKTSLTGAMNEIFIGANVAASRANTIAYFTGTGTVGTQYSNPDITQRMYLRRNRRIGVTESSANLLFTGFGDVGTAETFTATGNIWSAEATKMFFTAVGATDLALQLDEGIEMSRPKPMTGEAHFTRLSGVTMHNAKTFTDGKYMTVTTFVDASDY